MRFGCGINLLFHLVLSFRSPDFLTGKLSVAPKIQVLLNQTKKTSMSFFRSFKIGRSTRHYEVRVRDRSYLRSRLPGARFPRDEELARFANSRLTGIGPWVG